jgi:hypothetical protein
MAEKSLGKHLYFAPLNIARPQDGVGLYEYGTGRCKYYTDGGEWFFDMSDGEPTFYASEGALYHVDGTLITDIRIPDSDSKDYPHEEDDRHESAAAQIGHAWAATLGRR